MDQIIYCINPSLVSKIKPLSFDKRVDENNNFVYAKIITLR